MKKIKKPNYSIVRYANAAHSLTSVNGTMDFTPRTALFVARKKKKDKLVHDLYVAAARNCGVTRQTFAELVPSLNCFFLPFAHTCTHTHVQPRKYTEFMAKSFARPRRSPISRCNNNIFVCIRPCPRLSLSVFPSRCLENPKLDTRIRSSRHP